MRLCYFKSFISLILFSLSLLSTNNLYAEKIADSKEINVVIHVSNNYKRTYQAALNYTYSLQEYYGNNVQIAIVANGAGIGFVNSNNNYKDEIKGLLKDGVKISACNTTVRIMRKFKEIPIIKGVDFVPTGVVEVIKLQRKGYLYLNP